MKKISFICCYTKKDMLDDLQKSAGCLVDYEVEWVLIDNSSNRFPSAAAALNYGFDKSTSQIVVFLHQDIILYDQITIDRVVNAAECGCIVGFAGRFSDGGKIVSTISDGQNKDRIYDYDFKGKDWLDVLTCDECFIAMSRDTYNAVGGYDEKNFDGWHLYGVDFTLRAAQRHIPVVIVRANAWHRSHGTMDRNFDKYKNILRKIYKKDYKKIYYPCGWTYTNSFKYYGRYCARSLKRMLKRER